MMLKKACLVVSCFLLFPVASRAADDTLFGRWWNPYGPKDNAITFTMIGGNYFEGRGQELLDSGDYTQETWNVGLRLGYAFTNFVEVEGSLSYTPTQLATGIKENVYFYSINGVGQVPITDRFVPYLTVGAGAVSYDPDNVSKFTRFAINYGGGLKFFIFKNLALRPDVRGLTTFDSTQTALLTSLNLTYYASLRSEAEDQALMEAEMRKYNGIIEGIHFDVDSSVISRDSYYVLDRAGFFFRAHPLLRVVVEGHTDDRGSAALNERLSQDRADAVREYLLKRGVAKKQVEAKGFGFTKPIADNSTPEGKQKNRRMEFRILNPEILGR